MVDDVGVSKEELCYAIVKEVVQKSGEDFNEQNRTNNITCKEVLMCVLEEKDL